MKKQSTPKAAPRSLGAKQPARSKEPRAEQSARRRYWLLKSEAGCFSYDDLVRSPDHRTGWDGIRNHQARNFLRDDCAAGDLALFYHSNGDPPGVAGIARVSRGAHPDPTQFDPKHAHFDPKSRPDAPSWVQIEIEAQARFERFVSLEELRSDPRLATMGVLRRGQRLSVLPVEVGEWRAVVALGGLDPNDF